VEGRRFSEIKDRMIEKEIKRESRNEWKRQSVYALFISSKLPPMLTFYANLLCQGYGGQEALAGKLLLC
jgi:hypothetical protein